MAVKKQTPARGSKLGTSAGKSEAEPEAEETVANVEEVNIIEVLLSVQISDG